jgi:hypothetical protein
MDSLDQLNNYYKLFKKLRNMELCSCVHNQLIKLKYRIIKSIKIKWVGHVARMGKRNVYIILVGKAKRTRPLRRCSRRWEDNIKLELREIGLEGVDCILAQDMNRFGTL